MYHSITFGSVTNGSFIGKNTWIDWHLIPTSRPTVSQSQPISYFVNIPGREDGNIDMSEYLTGEVQYGQRNGSFEFYVDNDHENWITLLDKITTYLHGKNMKMQLEDDPNYYYEGRFSVPQWKSESWNSKVIIDYVVAPYKYKIGNDARSL